MYFQLICITGGTFECAQTIIIQMLYIENLFHTTEGGVHSGAADEQDPSNWTAA